MSMDAQVAGFCPMGCGKTLTLDEFGGVICSNLYCKNRAAVAHLLADQESEHIVCFDESGFIIRHPLRERLDDLMVACALPDHITNLDGPPVKPGRYRARSDGLRWTWETLPAITLQTAPTR